MKKWLVCKLTFWLRLSTWISRHTSQYITINVHQKKLVDFQSQKNGLVSCLYCYLSGLSFIIFIPNFLLGLSILCIKEKKT